MGILDIIFNDVLIVALASWFIAQLAKIVINAIVNKKIDFERLFGDGGMPSGHSATVTAAALMIGIHEGFATPIFGLALLFAIVVMHDATGVRREAGKHARSILNIVEQLNDYFKEHDDKIKTEKLKVLVGHTPLQVAIGSALGALIAFVYEIVFNNLLERFLN